MPSSRWLSVILIGYVSGVAIRSWTEYELSEYLFFFAIIAILALVVLWRRPALLPVFVLVSMAVIGTAQVNWEISKKTSDVLDNSINTISSVARDPDWRGSYASVVMRTKEGKLFETTINSSVSLSYGDEVSIECTPKAEKDRNSQLALAARGIDFRCAGASVVLTGKFKGNRAWAMMLRGKHALERSLSQNISEPEASLGLGFIFGGSSRMSQEMRNSFSRTGLTHIVAVSGYNVALIAEWITAVLLAIGMWRRQALLLSIIGVGIFVALVGLPASAVRAGVMISLVLWALAFGRLAGSHRALLLAGSVMCVINPLILRYDLGFQLSVLATLGIIEYQGIRSLTRNLPGKIWIDAAGTTMMAQIFVLPLLVYTFNSASLVFLIANMAVALLIPMAMVGSLVVACLGLMFQVLGIVSGWVAYIPLTIITRMVEFLASFSWASISISETNPIWIIAWYFMLGSTLILLHSRRRFRINSISGDE